MFGLQNVFGKSLATGQDHLSISMWHDCKTPLKDFLSLFLMEEDSISYPLYSLVLHHYLFHALCKSRPELRDRLHLCRPLLLTKNNKPAETTGLGAWTGQWKHRHNGNPPELLFLG